jgi:hypothetical protein
MIEAFWSGPRSPAGNWTALQHREYTRSPLFAEQCQSLGHICFDDGTTLLIRVRTRTKKDGLRLPVIQGYSSLIRECTRTCINRVSDLPSVKQERERALLRASVVREAERLSDGMTKQEAADGLKAMFDEENANAIAK